MNAMAARISVPEMGAIIQCMPYLASYPDLEQREWLEELLATSQDAMNMSILSMLPNLKSLTLDRHVDKWYDYNMERFFCQARHTGTLTTRLLEFATRPPVNAFPLFKNLSYLCIDGNNKQAFEEEAWEVGTVLVYLRLPALKTFIGRGCAVILDHLVEGEERLKDEQPSSNVTNITLVDCAIHTEDIRNVLRSCHALGSFKCSRLCQNQHKLAYLLNYSYAALHNDLYRHRESLRCLQLDSTSCGHHITMEDEPIETLAFLKNLEYLEVDEDVLVGNTWPYIRPLGDILPPNLPHVVIKGERNPYPQKQLFQAIGRAVLSGEIHATVEIRDACITNAEHALRHMPAIELREITDRHEVHSKSFCSFLISKRDDGTAEN